MASRCRVVLVEPRDARNVGMVARACANFGVKDLVVVHSSKLAAVVSRTDRSEAKARELGIESKGDLSKAECRFDVSSWKGCDRLATTDGVEVLNDARLSGNLSQAIVGARRAIAFSGREGENFRRPTVTLRELAKEVANQSTALPTALVFGSEDVGLPTDAILQCDGVCQLRTAGCMSLNLSHAVAVTLARLIDEDPPSRPSSPLLLHQPNLPSRERSRSRSPRGSVASSAQATSRSAAEPPGVWTTAWTELCRSRLESLGYPTQPNLWSSKGRRKCKFAYRLFKIVSGCARTLQRAHLTQDECDSWIKLVEVLSKQSDQTSPFTSTKTLQEEATDADVHSAQGTGSEQQIDPMSCDSTDNLLSLPAEFANPSEPK